MQYTDHKGRRYCFVVIPYQKDDEGYIPSLVIEGVKGHRPMVGDEYKKGYRWGDTIDLAYEVCQEANRRIGLTDEDIHDIVRSSLPDNEVMYSLDD